MKKKYLYLVLGLVLIIILLVVGKKQGWIVTGSQGEEVEFSTVELVDIVEKVSSSGKIKPEVEVKIAPEVSGEIITLNIKEGQEVKKGDLLVEINPDIYESMLGRAEAALNSAESSYQQAKAREKEAKQNWERNKKLFENNTIAASEWEAINANYMVAKHQVEAAKHQVASAKASLKESKDNLGRTKIYSPLDGTISKLNVELGERVVGTAQMAGTELLRVANLNSMEAEVEVNENDIIKVKLGDKADIEVDAFLDIKFEGVVTEIANSAETQGTSADQVTNFKVIIKILEESYRKKADEMGLKYSPFRPGMTATVDIKTRFRNGIVGVPISAVTTRKDTAKMSKKFIKKEEDTEKVEKKEMYEVVFVKNEDGTAGVRIVATGIQDDENIEVLSGLKEGETIITGPYTMVSRILKPGMRVREIEEEVND
jgi:HlyD family secretion protein